MKRRQFSAALASTAFALTGITAGTPALEREDDARQIQTEDVDTTVGGVTFAADSATMMYEGGTMTAQAEGVTMETANRSGSIARATATVEEISAETYRILQDGVVEAANAQSPLPLFAALKNANVNPEAPVTMAVESVTMDGHGAVLDSATATGTAGGFVPENAGSVAAGGSLADLEQMQFTEMTATSGGSTLTAREAVVSFGETTATIQMPEGELSTPTRSLAFAEANVVLHPPADVPQERVDALASLRAQVRDGSLTLQSVRDTLAESGVTVSDIVSSLLNVRFEAQAGNVTEGGESVAQNVGTSGTLGELLQVTGRKTTAEETETAQETEQAGLSKVAIVSSPGTEEYQDYTFEVTGDAENLEPDEDGRPAIDEVTQVNGRTRVEGTVGYGDDRYAFSGELIEVDVPASIQIEISER